MNNKTISQVKAVSFKIAKSKGWSNERIIKMFKNIEIANNTSKAKKLLDERGD